MVGQTRVATIQSPQYNPNYTNFVQQKNPSASPCSTSNYSPTPSPAYSTTLSKGSTSNLSVQAAQCTSNYSTSHLYSSGFSSHSNFSFCNSLNNNSNSHNSNNKSNNNSSSSSSNNSSNNICDNNSGDCSSTLKNSSRSQQPSFLAEEEVKFASTDQSSLFNYTKISKPNSGPTPKYTASQSNFANFSNNQLKYTTGQESIDLCFEKNSRSKKDYEVTQKHLKTFKEDETEIGCNFGEWQQFLSKHGTKIKHTSEANQDLVTDSFLHFLQKKTQEKNSQENYSYDFSDVSQILVSLTSKYKSEELSALKKKEGNEDSKLMNDFLTKILLEKEEKRFKSLDEKKKIVRKEIFDDFSNELDDKIKRDAMSQYQEEKTHHKRSTNFNDLNQWDYLNQQDIQNSNSNHNRREHFSFVGSSQAHSVGWNPMGMSMPRQSNPYYSNPHGHVLPAHAHSEFRYNQWNNPNQKNIPNIHNAHSQNTILPQSRLDTKHHPDISNSVTDFVLPGGPPSEFSKIRNSPRDIMLRTPPPDKCRSGLHSDHHASASPAIRNPTTRTPSLSTHSKTVISNPLSDLQMLVTNQESDDPTQKPDSYQQESVDLSAHSDTSKHKENSIKKEIQPVNENNSDRKEFRPPISVIQTKNKQVFSKKEEMCEKPVELTSKNSEKNTEGEISSSIRLNNLENNCQVNAKETGNKSEIVDKEVTNCTKNVEEPNKTSVIVEKDGKVSNTNEKIEEVIPKKAEANLENSKAKPVEMEVENTVQSEERTKPDELPEPEKEEKAALSVSEDVEKSETSNLIEGGTLTEVSPKIKSDIESSKRKASDEQSDNESKRTFLEVESQLEKMFGIGEENSDLPTVSSTSAEVRPSSSETSKKTPKKKPSRKSRAFRLSSGQSSSSESQFFNKKFRTSLNKEDNKKKVKKSICDSMDRRGPFLHIEGSKESPSCVTVINFPKGDDEDERDKSAVKKQSLNSIRPKHHNELDYRGEELFMLKKQQIIPTKVQQKFYFIQPCIYREI